MTLISRRPFAGHDGYGSLRDKVGGSGVKRILSAFADNLHDWPLMTPP
eukprot:CAMPEP_0194494182 /NCGR_PEP_ID=MMETSP0253-20130528/12168_1 /TAXON_ID=2966 /ORGANISM="Noctiluca scintillans" /LENGTH=47 /DNA_ID= /DNA_START= /DNA_END= /DNA_ORIENTATION=